MQGADLWTTAPPRLRITVRHAARSAAPRTPVLMLHGLWHGAWAWENWSVRLSEHGHDCYAVDLRGHGASAGDLRTARLRDYLEDARRAVAALPSAPILIGHSLGGTLVEHLASTGSHPAAVLVAGVPGRYPIRTVLRTAVRQPVATLSSVLHRDLAPLVGSPEAARRFLFSSATPDDIVLRTQQRLTSASPRIVRELASRRAARPTPATPTMVLAADGDAAFPSRIQRRRAKILGAEFREIAGSGHDIPLDHRWRDGADIVAAWVHGLM